MRTLAACIALVMAFSAPALAALIDWELQPEKSIMTIRGALGQDYPVPSFDSGITFDVANLGASRVIIKAEALLAFSPGKISPEMIEMMRVMRTPVTGETPSTAVFTAQDIQRVSAREFSMKGTLAINGRSKDITVPFTAAVEDAGYGNRYFVIKGVLTFNPRDFAGGGLPDPGTDKAQIGFILKSLPRI
jgi:hypothetical protein